MRTRPALLLVSLTAIVLVLVAFVLFVRARSRAAYGPAVAVCPGPDHYGYTCEDGNAYSYIDATTRLGLMPMTPSSTLICRSSSRSTATSIPK